MKKILCLIFCLVCSVFALVSCSDEVVDPVPDHYPSSETEVEDVSVDLYIIVGEGTTDNALSTVSRQIAAETLRNYHTEVNVKYLTAAEYEQTVLSAVNTASADDEEKRGIIALVHSSAFMDTLEATGKLLDLSGYLNTKAFGSLNVSIPKSLLAAAKSENALYAIPNNHVLGEYTYLVINEEVAREQLKYSPKTLASYTSYEQTEQLRADMEAIGLDSNKYVTTVTGTYATKAELVANGNVCNVISVPQINSADAFESAFAIVDSGDALINERTMEIVYALNIDTNLRDMLQYGVKNTNYTVVETKDENGNVISTDIVLEDDIDMYRMNYIYTGNAFILSYCSEIGWTEEFATVGKHQNADSVYVGG